MQTTQTINARPLVGNGFPPDAGAHLARRLIADGEIRRWDELEIDLMGCPPSLLISAFFNGFLQEVWDGKPDLLDQARKIKWKLSFDFQRDSVKQWMRDFKPYTDAKPLAG
jgi:hypothetical protein